MPKSKTPRLDQLLSSLGYCSRTEARHWIREGRVRVDGVEEPNFSERYLPELINVDGESLDHPDGLFLLLNKPKGLVCSHSELDGPSVYSLFSDRWLRRDPKLVSVGRLDKDTTGALLITDQHEWVQKLLSPKKKVSKIYLVEVNKEIDLSLIEIFQSGSLVLKGEKKPCLPAKLKILAPRKAELELFEGKYHQVKRMFAACGYEVLELHRSRFDSWSVEDLGLGEFKFVSFKAI